MKEKSIEPMAVSKKSRPWYCLPTALFFVGVFSIILLLWVNHLSKRDHVDSLIIDAIMDIEINAASVHFRLAEAADRNVAVDVKKINEFIDEAIKLTDSILNSGESEHGRITEPLNDPNLRSYAEGMRQNLVKLKTIVLKRSQNPGKSVIGSFADQQINAILAEILRDGETLDDLIGKDKVKEWEKYNRLFAGILIIWISFITAATAGLWGYEKRREKSKKALRRSEENLKLYQTLINQSNDSIELLDPETGNLLNVNKKTCIDLGYSREELLSMKVFDIDPVVKPSDYPKIMEDIRKTGGSIWNGIHLRKDGSTFPVEVSLKIVQLDRSYLVAVARDITERRKADEEREKLIIELKDALSNVKTLRGMLPICSYCKKIRDDKGYWEQVDMYITRHTDTAFSHGMCPECAEKAMKEFKELKKESGS